MAIFWLAVVRSDKVYALLEFEHIPVTPKQGAL